jgi:hypothetical protein
MQSTLYALNKNNVKVEANLPLLDRVICFCFLLFAFYVTNPFLREILPTPFRYVLIVLFLLSPFFIFFSSIKSEHKKIIIFFSPLIIAFILLYYLGKYQNSTVSFISYFTSIFYFFVFASFALFFLNKPKPLLKKFFLIVTFFMVIVSITTIFGLLKYPMASRHLAGGGTEELNNTYNRMNIGGYSTVYSIEILLPIYYGYFSLQKKKGFPTFLLILFNTVIFLSQYIIASILAIITFFAAILFFGKRAKRNLSILLFIVAIFAVLWYPISTALSFVSDYLLSKNMNSASERILLISGFMKGKGWSGDAEGRLELYGVSAKSFFENPFTGNLFFKSSVGGHSEILDSLCSVGLPIFLLILSFFCLFFKDSLSFVCKPNKKYIYMSILLFVLIALFNTVFSSPSIGLAVFLAPIFVFGYSYENYRN